MLVERGVVRLESDAIRIEADRVSGTSGSAGAPRRAVSIGEDEFYELLAQKDSDAPELLRRFLEKADRIGSMWIGRRV
jgi:hypothetical protein